jgi:hypothetical protein
VTATGDAPPAPVASGAGVPPPRRTIRWLLPDRATWPLWACTAGMPFSYLIGFHGFSWCIPGVVLGVRILTDRTVRFPRSTLPMIVFMGWILLSITVLSKGSGYVLFAYRWTLFAGALATLVWLVNVPEDVVSSERIVDWLATLWVTLVVFGFLGKLMPGFSHHSPLQTLLGPIGRIGFVDEISSWRFAETQGFLGYPLPRPAAPFGGTNGWGAAMGILTPFFYRSWIAEAGPARRRIGIILGFVAIYPIVISVNRGLWISLGAGLVYYAARKALRGRMGPFLILVAVMAAISVALVATPVGTLVQDRLNNAGTERSNASRSDLYHLAFEGAKESPLIGHGTPERATGALSTLPPVGTHGMLWYLMYVHGFVGLGLFLAWLGSEVLSTGRVRNSITWWAHLSLVIALVEVPFYGLLPQVVLFGVAAGLAHREDHV